MFRKFSSDGKREKCAAIWTVHLVRKFMQLQCSIWNGLRMKSRTIRFISWIAGIDTIRCNTIKVLHWNGVEDCVLLHLSVHHDPVSAEKWSWLCKQERSRTITNILHRLVGSHRIKSVSLTNMKLFHLSSLNNNQPFFSAVTTSILCL